MERALAHKRIEIFCVNRRVFLKKQSSSFVHDKEGFFVLCFTLYTFCQFWQRQNKEILTYHVMIRNFVQLVAFYLSVTFPQSVFTSSNDYDLIYKNTLLEKSIHEIVSFCFARVKLFLGRNVWGAPKCFSSG